MELTPPGAPGLGTEQTLRIQPEEVVTAFRDLQPETILLFFMRYGPLWPSLPVSQKLLIHSQITKRIEEARAEEARTLPGTVEGAVPKATV